MEKLIIDKDTLKAISVDSRLNILKLLHKRKYTLSELSNLLKLSPSTLKEHLDILCNASLIKKEENSRKWKYYSLTFKGLNIINPNQTKAFFSFILGSIVTIGLLFLFLSNVLFFPITSSSNSRPQMKSMGVYSIQSEGLEESLTNIQSTDDLVYVSDVDLKVNSSAKSILSEDIKLGDGENKFIFKVNWLLINLALLIIFSLFTVYLFVYYIKQKNKIK